MAETFAIKGFEELNRALEAFPDKIAKNVLRGMVSAGSGVVLKEAKSRAKIGKKEHEIFRGGRKRGKQYAQPGFLKKGIRKARRRVRVKGVETYAVGVWEPKGSDGFWPYYWRFKEFGTSKMAAEPFLRPALDTQTQAVIEKMREYGERRVEKEAEKLRKSNGY